MDLEEAFRAAIGFILVVTGIGIIAGFWWTVAGPIVGLIFIAAGLLLMGYPKLANWLKNLSNR